MSQDRDIESKPLDIEPVIRKINALWVVRQEINVHPYYFSHTQQDVDYHTSVYMGDRESIAEERVASRDTLIDYRLDELIPITHWHAVNAPQFTLVRSDWQSLESHLEKNYQRELTKMSEDKCAQRKLVLHEMGAFAITKIGLFDRIGSKSFDSDLSNAVHYLGDSSRSMHEYHEIIEEKTREFQENYTKPAYQQLYDRERWWRRVRNIVAQTLKRPNENL